MWPGAYLPTGDPDDANQIRIAKSTNGGLSFDEQEAAVTFLATKGRRCWVSLDQGETGTAFRSNGYPALTVDNAGRVYLRGPSAIAMATPHHDGRHESRRVMAQIEFQAIDSGAVYDDYGIPSTIFLTAAASSCRL